jgi:cytochrome c-type biogenesis protein CcmE
MHNFGIVYWGSVHLRENLRESHECGVKIMEKRKIKFLIGSLVIVASIAWLGFSGFDESLAYYKTVDELKLMKGDAYDKRLRVAGNVVAGSIERLPGAVKFRLEQKGDILPVSYIGKDLLPDTFKDGAQALAEGHLTRHGEFEASKIHAKCASKYEATYNTKEGKS